MKKENTSESNATELRVLLYGNLINVAALYFLTSFIRLLDNGAFHDCETSAQKNSFPIIKCSNSF